MPTNALIRGQSASRYWTVIWGVFLAGFVAVGFGGVREEMKKRVRVSSKSPLSSTDTVFMMTLGVENASARIANCLSDVPADEPVAVVYQNAPIAGLDALLIGSLAWPRPIPHIPLKPDEVFDAAKLREVNATRAVFFLGMPRPAGSENVRSLSPLCHFYRAPAPPR